MLTILIPVFNEEESLPALHKELIRDIPLIDGSYEIIFVDDGSNDRSLEILKKLDGQNSNIKVFSFRKNQGKAEALTFGFQKAKGDYIATLDADLQDKPIEIKNLLEKVKSGWDLACGWREKRQDSPVKVFSSKIFNFLASFFWGTNLHDYNCGLKVFRKEVAKRLRLYGGLHRFIPLLVQTQGFIVGEVAVEHRMRKFGKSKYGLSKLWKDLPDIFTVLFLNRYSKRPMHFFGLAGGLLFFVGIVILGYLAFLRFQGETIGQRPLFFFGMLMVLSGLQTFFTGFLADLMINLSYKKENKDTEDVLLKYSSKT